MRLISMLVTLAGRVDQWAKGPSLSATARAVAAENLTYLSPAKMLRLESAVTRSLKSSVSGDVVEFGIALGGSAIVLAKHARRHGRRFHGFDVFGLIPAPASDKDDDNSKKRYEIIASGKSEGIGGEEYYGYRRDLYREVCETFARYGIAVDDLAVKLHKGLFEDTLPPFPASPIAFAHVDCDWYHPVKFCLSEIAKRSRVGTTIVLDDFNDWTGCRRATVEFLSSHPDYIFEDGPNVILKRTALDAVPAEYSRDK